jgi:enamine deaminase RidA (YjgF/YER057c/UK114 family)
MRPSQRLTQLGLVLPPVVQPAFKYVPVVVHGDVAYVSGQLPRVDGEIRWTGALGGGVSLEEGRAAARACAVQALACLAAALGTIDRVARIIKLTGFVQSVPDFHQQPAVIDAASELMLEVFGEDGRHARSAVGVAALPRNVPVELEVVAAIAKS